MLDNCTEISNITGWISKLLAYLLSYICLIKYKVRQPGFHSSGWFLMSLCASKDFGFSLPERGLTKILGCRSAWAQPLLFARLPQMSAVTVYSRAVAEC